MGLWNRLFAIGIIMGCIVALKGDRASAGGAVFVDINQDYKTQSGVRTLVTELKQSPFDEVIVKVVDQGHAWYGSRVLPMPPGVSPGFDPLQALIQGLKGAEQPKRVIAWIDPLAVGNEANKRQLAPQHILNTNTDLLSQAKDGRRADLQGIAYLEPGLPDVQAMIAQIVQELCSDYAIDGIYADPVSDPSADWGFHPEVVQVWQEAHPDSGPPLSDSPEWTRLRAQVLSAFVGRLAQVAGDAGKPFIAGALARGPAPASAQAFAQSAVFTANHQDWPTWLREGLVQRLILKVYVVEGTNTQSFDQWVAFGVGQATSSSVPVDIAVSGTMNVSVDVLAQIRRASAAGAQRVAISNFKDLTSDRDARMLFMRTLEKTVFDPGYLARINQREQLFGDQAAATSDETAVSSAVGDSERVPVPAQSDPDYTLPPPPIDDAQGGKFIPLEKTDREMAEALTILAGSSQRATPRVGTPDGSAPAAGGTASADGAPSIDDFGRGGGTSGIYTREDMLRDIINDPLYQQSQSMFAVPTQARDYLRKMYPNVF